MSAETFDINEIINRYHADKTSSLAILQDIQAKFGYLPRAALEQAAKGLAVSPGEIYQLATFFRAFSLHPKGEYVVKVCLGTACHVRGGPAILDNLERALQIKAGNTTSDNKMTLEAVRCVGACALGPIVLVNEEPHGNMTGDKATRLVGQIKSGEIATAATPAAPVSPSRAPVDLSAVPPAGR